jgi:hypothetical protein
MSQDVSQRRGLFGSTVKGITKVGGGHDKMVDTRPPSNNSHSTNLNAVTNSTRPNCPEKCLSIQPIISVLLGSSVDNLSQASRVFLDFSRTKCFWVSHTQSRRGVNLSIAAIGSKPNVQFLPFRHNTCNVLYEDACMAAE